MQGLEKRILKQHSGPLTPISVSLEPGGVPLLLQKGGG